MHLDLNDVFTCTVNDQNRICRDGNTVLIKTGVIYLLLSNGVNLKMVRCEIIYLGGSSHR